MAAYFFLFKNVKLSYWDINVGDKLAKYAGYQKYCISGGRLMFDILKLVQYIGHKNSMDYSLSKVI